MSSDDRPKRSWREIDQMRDRGGSSGPRKVSKVEERAQKLASKAARADLEKLFSESPLNKEMAERLKEIQSSRGTKSFGEKLNGFLRDYGIPRDWETLQVFLDHSDPAVLCDLLDQVLKIAPKSELRVQDLIAAKLRVLELSTFDRRVIEKIHEIKKAILR